MEKLPLQDQGPPEEVTEAGVFLHPCEGEAVCKLTNEKARCSPHLCLEPGRPDAAYNTYQGSSLMAAC